ncbi:hypothetical protein POUND7_000235 [Theobroma cacao]
MCSESCDRSVLDEVEENTNSMDEDTISNTNQEISPAQGPTLPILQKVINLSNSIQNLKMEHEILSNQVKGITTDSFPGHDVVGTIQLLNNEYELLKKKYLDESSERKRLYNEIKQAAEGTQEVPGLVEAPVYSTEEVWELLKSGSRVRSVGATNANELSSRSHCLLRVTVRGTNLINGQKTRSHLWLVDLAGSERVGKIEVEGERLKESQFINKSLSALGDVISALASKTGHAEKLKHDEKETKKLQDNVQSLQLRLAAREHICKSLQEKVRDLENQLAEERKTRLKQETRAFAAAASSRPSLTQAAERTKMEKKPPLGPSKLRLPLRRLTNFMPPASPMPTNRKTARIAMATSDDKENYPKTVMAPPTNTKALLKPRRVSIAVRPSTTTTQVIQPKRRVSIATLQPHSYMTTPLRSSASGFNNGGTMDRPSLVRDPRKARYSRLFSPLPEFRNPSETTPAATRSSSKFMGSPPPPAQAGSWKPRHPTVVALQRKSVVWSPLKLRGMQSHRKSSLLPLRPSALRE